MEMHKNGAPRMPSHFRIRVTRSCRPSTVAAIVILLLVDEEMENWEEGTIDLPPKAPAMGGSAEAIPPTMPVWLIALGFAQVFSTDR
jgi:hypothetical protein